MEVIKIEGVKEDAYIIQSNLEVFLPHYPIFIINIEKVLYKFIEELEVNDSLLFRLKIAKEIDFTGISVMLKDKITEEILIDNITSLSNLIHGIDEYMVKNCNLIIDTEDNDLISEITQALIYLDIELDVMMKKEKSDRKILNAFRRQFEKIRASVVKGEKALYNLDVIDEFSHEKHALLTTFNDIEDDLEKARDRSLKISVMATKKAGKSVIVNSFLNEQYAPTSLEIPTPNTCIYKKSKDGNLRLIYGEADILFKNPEDMYKYTYNEFKKAQNDKEHGYTIDDMEIYYTDENNSLTSFTIIDTPGSNYSLAKDSSSGENIHKNITFKWIEKSDVVLFLINYSSYLSTDEDELLKSIKLEFEKHNKFYSLVVVVNKLDDMFISECENKSVVRFLDYIKCKLNDLGYSEFVVMGTSARSYFDIIKVCRIDSDIIKDLGEMEPIEKLKGSQLRARLKTLKEKFIGKNEMSTLSFIDDQLEKLECFYGLVDYDLNTLKEKSGVPSLVNYTTYIAMQKAHIEVYGALIRSIDEKYLKVKNRSILHTLMDLKKEMIDEIQENGIMLQNITNSFESIKRDMEEKLSFEDFKSNFINIIQTSEDKALQHVSKSCENKINEFFMKLMLKNSEELKNLKNKTMDIDLSINNRRLNEEMNTITEKFLKELNIELVIKHIQLKDAESKMKSLMQTFSEIIRKEYNLKDFNIEVPKIDQYYKKMLQVYIPTTYNTDSIVKEKLLNTIQIHRNSISKLFNLFTKNIYETYTINSKELQRIKSESAEYLIYNTNNEYCQYYELLRSNLLNCVNDYKSQIDEFFKNMKTTFESIVSDVFKDLSDSKVNIEKQLTQLYINLHFYNEIYRISKDFIKEWNIIRDME
ncbi:MAG: dynamin family protein [Clostridium sp.]